MSKLQTFIEENNIKCESVMVGENPNMHDQNWQAYHYKVTLKRDKTYDGFRERRQFTLFFSMGIGISHEPYTDDVLECLASDSASIENARHFEDWCADLGYDGDSRRAERTYKITCKQAEKFEKFLGVDLYHDLLWNTEY